jgi:hypothetical protein
MSARQSDLFGTTSHPSHQPNEKIVTHVRARRHATLAHE